MVLPSGTVPPEYHACDGMSQAPVHAPVGPGLQWRRLVSESSHPTLAAACPIDRRSAQGVHNTRSLLYPLFRLLHSVGRPRPACGDEYWPPSPPAVAPPDARTYIWTSGDPIASGSHWEENQANRDTVWCTQSEGSNGYSESLPAPHGLVIRPYPQRRNPRFGPARPRRVPCSDMRPHRQHPCDGPRLTS